MKDLSIFSLPRTIFMNVVLTLISATCYMLHATPPAALPAAQRLISLMISLLSAPLARDKTLLNCIIILNDIFRFALCSVVSVMAIS